MKPYFVLTVLVVLAACQPVWANPPQHTVKPPKTFVTFGQSITTPNTPISPQELRSNQLHQQVVSDWLTRMQIHAERDMLIGNYQDVIDLYAKVRSLPGGQDPCWPNQEVLAEAYAANGQPQQALQVFHDYFYKKHPGTNQVYGLLDNLKPVAYCTYSLLELQAGNWKEAAAAFDLAGAYHEVQFYELNPPFTSPSVSYMLKLLSRQAPGNKIGGAIPALRLFFSPDYPQPALLRAACEVVLGESLISTITTPVYGTISGSHLYDRAVYMLADAVAQAPNLKTAWYYSGDALAHQMHYRQALSAMHRALLLNGSSDAKFAGYANEVIDRVKADRQRHFNPGTIRLYNP